MNADGLLEAGQVSWLVLCVMMLVSRFAFRREGPVGMRRFLDAWKTSRTHRVWGLAACVWGLALAAGAVARRADLTGADLLLLGSVSAVLCADGLLNSLPSGFATFKERMQDAWVRRHEGGVRASDEHLFARVNLLLGLAATAVGLAVYFYDPLPLPLLAFAFGSGVLLTFALIGACKREARQAP